MFYCSIVHTCTLVFFVDRLSTETIFIALYYVSSLMCVAVCFQMFAMNTLFQNKWRKMLSEGIVLFLTNVWPPYLKLTNDNSTISWGLFDHLLYSSDFLPSNYLLSLHMKHKLKWKMLWIYKEISRTYKELRVIV